MPLQHQHRHTNLLGDVKAGNACEDTLVFQSGKAEHVGGQKRQTVDLVFDNIQIFQLLFLGQVFAFHEPHKAFDGHKGGFEFVGEIVDKVGAEDF